MRFSHSGLALAGLVLAALTLASCGDPQPKQARTVAVDQLTFADVQQRVRDAVSRPGYVLHSAETRSIVGQTLLTDAWIDLERHVARIDHDGSPYWILSADKIASLGESDGRYVESTYEAPGYDEPLLGYVFYYTRRILAPDVTSEGVRATDLDGAAAIEVKISQEMNSDGNHYTERDTIYLDEAFLPLKSEIDAGPSYPKSVSTYRNEYLARDQVARDLFSFEQLKAVAKTAGVNLREAAAPLGRAYWLGDPFEAMRLHGVNADKLDDGELLLRLGYETDNMGSSGSEAPFPCASINQYTKRGWNDRRQLVSQNDPGARNRILRDTRQVLGSQAQIYEQPADRVLQQPYPEGQPSPTPPTLAESSAWSAEIVFDGAVVELDISCGPPGKNPYRSLDGVRHLLDALQVLDVP